MGGLLLPLISSINPRQRQELALEDCISNIYPSIYLSIYLVIDLSWIPSYIDGKSYFKVLLPDIIHVWPIIVNVMLMQFDNMQLAQNKILFKCCMVQLKSASHNKPNYKKYNQEGKGREGKTDRKSWVYGHAVVTDHTVSRQPCPRRVSTQAHVVHSPVKAVVSRFRM